MGCSCPYLRVFLRILLIFQWHALICASFEPSSRSNMNGIYALSSTPKQDVSKFPKQYRDYPGGANYFDVYSPVITSLYSQVFWKGLEPVSIPSQVREEFDGKVMAVIGFEVDQVRVDERGSEVSVPINVAYNHHFETRMAGKKSSFERYRQSVHRTRTGHGHGKPAQDFVLVDHFNGTNAYPTGQNFGPANGGEFRKSFHGYAPGYAKLIESPQTVQITPMQIDTWNRDKMDINGGPFVAGPLPRNSLAPIHASYSGLLECPVTTRITKELSTTFETRYEGNCRYSLDSMAACREAAKRLDFPPDVKLVYTTDSTEMKGCSVRFLPQAKRVVVNFNSNKKLVERNCSLPDAAFVGAKSSLVELGVQIDPVKDRVVIRVEGPANVWFGVGFNAQAMKDHPWAIVVDGIGRVSEHQLDDQGGGATHKELPPSIRLESHKVENNRRTVVVSRKIRGEIFSFNHKASHIPFINAIGSTVELHYHRFKEPSTLSIFPVNVSACVCSLGPSRFGRVKGQLVYEGRERVAFNNFCLPYPRTVLLEQRNPTCDLRAYSGGQLACHHMWSLLDADQEIPWQDKPLVYRLKFRFWYQEYTEGLLPSHKQIKRTTWGLGSPVEYDVPKCNHGIQGCSWNGKEWIHTITGTWKVPDSNRAKRLVAAHFHCHAPTCIEISLFDNSTGKVICTQRPIYGGTNRIDQKRFDEMGYIAQPPCLWGSGEHGLEPPYLVSGKVLHAVKRSNATNGHHGEMAWLQMLYTEDPIQPVKQTVVVANK